MCCADDDRHLLCQAAHGRSATFEDLNRQARAWCRDVANRKPKQTLGMSAAAAYIIEQPHRRPLPDMLPPVHDLFERVVDLHGYVFGRHQPLFSPRTLRRQAGLRLQDALWHRSPASG